MRLAVAFVLLSCGLAGCSQGDAGSETPDSGAPGDSGGEADLSSGPVHAPSLQVGKSWTYRTAGYWDSTEEITVVVARADEAGYELAGATRADLADEVAWDRSFFGAFDKDMKPTDGGTEGWVRFPLNDGDDWSLGGVPVVARRANVTTPNGTAPGFLIRGESDGVKVEVDYVPSLATVTHYLRRGPGAEEPAETLDLVSSGTSATWVTLERGDEIYYSPVFGDPAPASSPAPVQLQVTAEDDYVYVWALAAVGSRVAVHTGGASAWTFDGRGIPGFGFQEFPASPGPWTVAAAPGGQDAWAYVQMHAIRFSAGP